MRPSAAAVLAPSVLAAVFCAREAASDTSDRKPAFLLVDQNLARSADAARIVDAIRSQVVGLFEPAGYDEYRKATGILDGATPGRNERRRKALIEGIREGTALFYDSTAVLAATRTLESSTGEFLDAPYLVAGDLDALREVCEGAVLLMRLYQFRNLLDEARVLARRITEVFESGMVSEVDVPPDAAALLDEAAGEVRHAVARVRVEVVPGNGANGARLYRDGFPVPGSMAWTVPVPEGRHEWTLVTPAGNVLSRRHEAVGDAFLRFDPQLVGRVTDGPSDTLAVVPSEGGTDVAGRTAQRIADLTGFTVLVARGPSPGAGDGWVTVRVVDRSGSATSDLVRLRTGGDGSEMEVLLDSEGPLVARRPWPWPWVSAGVSAGFLAAGAYLNWAANQDADAVNRGENRVSSYDRNRTWAIVNYALAAAGAGTAVILYFVRPRHRSRYIIGAAPTGEGAAVSLSGRF